MPYHALCFDTPACSAERWADALLAAGALSVDLADACAGTPSEHPLYGEPGQTPLPPWPVSRLVALFDATQDVQAALTAAASWVDLPAPAHSLTAVADADWVREAQSQFVPLKVSERLWIVPSWREPIDPGAVNVRLDPGWAFGTGSHPTTGLCLRWLAENLEALASVLDYGCGSGILAIAAAKLGAGEVAGVDVDPQAIAASRANAAANGVAAAFGLPDELRGGQFDVVVANILAQPLELLAPVLAQRVRGAGRVVLSGILEAQAHDVAAAYGRWFNIVPWGSAEGWVTLAGVRFAP